MGSYRSVKLIRAVALAGKTATMLLVATTGGKVHKNQDMPQENAAREKGRVFS